MKKSMLIFLVTLLGLLIQPCNVALANPGFNDPHHGPDHRPPPAPAPDHRPPPAPDHRPPAPDHRPPPPAPGPDHGPDHRPPPPGPDHRPH